MKRVWITWESQRRNRTTSEILGATLFEFDYGASPTLIRYPLCVLKTLFVWFRHRPGLICVQNPSLLLAALGVAYGRLFGIPVVVDAHNAGLFPFDGEHGALNWIANRVIRSASLTIVTAESLANFVRDRGGEAAVLPDPIPSIQCPSESLSLQGRHNVLFICSWAPDEPYLEVLAAADQLDPSICIYMTGDSKRKEHALGRPIPENVVLTGYLPDDEFESLLCSVDATMDLTTRDDCLLCGAYESVAAGKPLILSDTRALRDHFSKGVVYAENNAGSIASAVQTCLDRRAHLTREIVGLKTELASSWIDLRDELEERLLVLQRHGQF